ncbi:dephospho-CoA kinase family protein [Cryptosporidium ryanae]|uniref:dephospho-CoA kinase family protein n=1 Tax=Cryptosporidium ryanae TaxID=515981 RepID=UPI00351A6CC4|nr:dephospho-CoA kinase family protein [Cryptosporidium ryanae]
MSTATNLFESTIVNILYCLVIVRFKKRNYSEIDQFFLVIPLFVIVNIAVYHNYLILVINLALYLCLQRVIVPCVTGGVACGKTQVTNKLADKGYEIIDMDIISREIVSVGKPAYREIVKYFGEDILDKNLEINRKKLRTVIFNDSNKRKKLNEITHFHIIVQTIIKVIYYRIYLSAVKFTSIKTIIVSPLLFENALLTKVTSPIYVVATTTQLQVKNLIERDKCTEDLAIKMISSQMDLKVKCQLADKVIWNTGTLEELYENTNKAFKTRNLVSGICLKFRDYLPFIKKQQ